MQRRYLSSQWLKAGHVRGRKNRLFLPSFDCLRSANLPLPRLLPPFLSARENFKCKFSEDERNFQVKWTTGFETFFENKKKKSNSLFQEREGRIKNQLGVLRFVGKLYEASYIFQANRILSRKIIEIVAIECVKILVKFSIVENHCLDYLSSKLHDTKVAITHRRDS